MADKFGFKKKNGYVTVSTAFIDNYATEANPSYVIIYLCALRAAEMGGIFGYEYFADRIGAKESFVKKAFEYWEKNNVIKIENGIIEFLEIESNEDENETKIEVKPQIIEENNEIKEKDENKDDDEKKLPKKNFFPNYSIEDYEKFSSEDSENCRILMKMAENQLYGRPINYNERNFVLALFYEFGFSLEVLTVLFYYCGSNDKKDRRYIEKVAYDWYEKNIDTSEKAEIYLSQYEDINLIMRWLGINEEPSKSEKSKIEKWMNEYNFSMDVIKKGCEITVENTMPNNKKGRFNYAERIFSTWNKEGISNLSDISKRELDFQENKKKKETDEDTRRKASSFSGYSDQREFTPSEGNERQRQLMEELLAGGSTE